MVSFLKGLKYVRMHNKISELIQKKKIYKTVLYIIILKNVVSIINKKEK